eukprot:scaffold19278_cov30-Phaeocystis_antarctica.AAC.1
MWKTGPIGPASAAQVADWPRLAEARGSPEARSVPGRGLRRASWPRSEPPCFPHSSARSRRDTRRPRWSPRRRPA